jgi:hypothetical protein
MMNSVRRAKIIGAAMRWGLLYRAANKARARRGDYRCEAEAENEAPCWMEYNREGDPLPRDEWCADCLRRQRFHIAYRRLARRRGAAQRSLLYHATRAMNEREVDDG